MKLFIYRYNWYTFYGTVYAPNGPRHEELLVVANNREDADKLILKKDKEKIQKIRDQIKKAPNEHVKEIPNEFDSLLVSIISDWLEDKKSKDDITVTEHELHLGLVVSIKNRG